MRKALQIAWAVGVLLLAAGPAFGGTQVLAPSDDTFINGGNPGNNNGGSSSVFTGTDGHGGLMRTLVRFAMPAGLQGRAIVMSAQLRLTLRALPNGTVGVPAVDTLAALTQPWAQGNGSGELPGTITVGLACGGTITGATWTQTNCATATSWTTPGGTVAAASSGQASTTGVVADTAVVWDSALNPAMNADVQSWIDTPASNDGWRIASSTEGDTGSAQRFYSTEAGTFAPSLTVTYACKQNFVDNGTTCLPASSVPAAPPWALVLLAGALVVAATRAARRWPAWPRSSRRGGPA
jgi:hypothetical protein